MSKFMISTSVTQRDPTTDSYSAVITTDSGAFSSRSSSKLASPADRATGYPAWQNGVVNEVKGYKEFNPLTSIILLNGTQVYAYSAPAIPPGTPLPTAPPTNLGGTDGYWKDANTFVGYYACMDPNYPCPTESANPDFKIISKTRAAIGSHGGCASCAMTEIVWQRRVPTGTPPVTSPPVTTPPGCPEGTTRSVKCPKTQQMITQQCVGGTWVTIKADEKKCAGEDPIKAIIAAVILAIVIIYLGSKA